MVIQSACLMTWQNTIPYHRHEDQKKIFSYYMNLSCQTVSSLLDTQMDLQLENKLPWNKYADAKRQFTQGGWMFVFSKRKMGKNGELESTDTGWEEWRLATANGLQATSRLLSCSVFVFICGCNKKQCLRLLKIWQHTDTCRMYHSQVYTKTNPDTHTHIHTDTAAAALTMQGRAVCCRDGSPVWAWCVDYTWWSWPGSSGPADR